MKAERYSVRGNNRERGYGRGDAGEEDDDGVQGRECT